MRVGVTVQVWAAAHEVDPMVIVEVVPLMNVRLGVAKVIIMLA